MTKKETRLRQFGVYEDVYKICSDLLVNEQETRLRTFEVSFVELKDTWCAYEDSHYDYYIKVQAGEEKSSLREEHLKLKSRHGVLYISMEDKIKLLTPALPPVQDNTLLDQSNGNINKAKQLKEDILHQITSIKAALDATEHSRCGIANLSTQAVTIGQEIDQMTALFESAMQVNPANHETTNNISISRPGPRPGVPS